MECRKCEKMDEKVEVDSSFSTNVVQQLLSTKASTLALMTTSILLFLTLVAKRISSKPSEVILTEKYIRSKVMLTVISL